MNCVICSEKAHVLCPSNDPMCSDCYHTMINIQQDKPTIMCTHCDLPIENVGMYIRTYRLEKDLERKRIQQRYECMGMLDKVRVQIEELVDRRCPKCKKVYYEFDGCCALTCDCGAFFCALCEEQCESNDICHIHVEQCSMNFWGNGVYCTWPQIRKSTCIFKARKIRQLLQSIEYNDEFIKQIYHVTRTIMDEHTFIPTCINNNEFKLDVSMGQQCFLCKNDILETMSCRSCFKCDHTICDSCFDLLSGVITHPPNPDEQLYQSIICNYQQAMRLLMQKHSEQVYEYKKQFQELSLKYNYYANKVDEHLRNQLNDQLAHKGHQLYNNVWYTNKRMDMTR